jgi:hypothetical protein
MWGFLVGRLCSGWWRVLHNTGKMDLIRVTVRVQPRPRQMRIFPFPFNPLRTPAVGSGLAGIAPVVTAMWLVTERLAAPNAALWDTTSAGP